jgi:hypothetical protein
MFATALPSKASLLLALGPRQLIQQVVGWPVLAVAPDRDFVYAWNVNRRDLIGRLETIVTRSCSGPAPRPAALR